MKKVIIFFLFSFIYCIGNSQNTTTQNLGAPRTLVINKGGFQSDSSLIIPHFSDTTTANISQYVKYYPGNIIRVGDLVYIRNSTATKWVKVGSGGGGGGGTFESNIIMNADAGNRLGYWTNGDTIPVAGKTLDEAFTIITQKAVHPTYTKPTQTMTGTPTATTYEIGYNLGTITFSTTYIQNDGGARNSNIFKRIVGSSYTTLPGNTDTCSALITARSYKSYFGYDSGLCKNNNLGQLDCTGHILAGNDSSSAITYTPIPAVYWGYLNANTSPTSAQVRAKLGGDSLLTTTKNRTYAVTVSGSNKYPYIAYPKNMNILTSILMGGFETLPAFSPAYEVDVTNSKGYTQVYYVYVNRNPFNAGSLSMVAQ